MQSDVNFPLVLCKPTSQIIQPKFNQCKRFVLHPHFPIIHLTISILGSSIIFGFSLKYTLRFVPSTEEHRPMYMKDWINILDDFLRISRKDILTHAGKISAKLAKEKADTEYDKFKERTKNDLSPVEIHFLENFERERKRLSDDSDKADS